MFYLLQGDSQRTDITYMKDMLNGYQEGRCFYCGEMLDQDHIHVDHVIPRTYIAHDKHWNLVLSHEFCNESKSDYLPSEYYIQKLVDRYVCTIITKLSSLLDLIVFEDMRCIHKILLNTIRFRRELDLCEFVSFCLSCEGMNRCFSIKTPLRRLADGDSDCAGRRKMLCHLLTHLPVDFVVKLDFWWYNKLLSKIRIKFYGLIRRRF